MDWLRSVFSSEIVAAWVQGIGSILAVAVAIYVPWKLRHDARADAEKERQLKARSIALRLLPALLDLQPQLKQSIANIRAIEPGMTGPVIMYVVQAATLSAPDELTEVEDRLYLLGKKVSFPLQQFLAFLNQHGRDLQRAQKIGMTTVDYSGVPGLQKEIVESLTRLDKLLDTSIERLRPIHNGEE